MRWPLLAVRGCGTRSLASTASTFHGLRHCAASLMLASGADVAVVSKLLGHASISITAGMYGHLIGTVASDAVNGAARLIAQTVHTLEGVSA